jgi:hypothetical protein
MTYLSTEMSRIACVNECKGFSSYNITYRFYTKSSTFAAREPICQPLSLVIRLAYHDPEIEEQKRTVTSA